MLTEAESKALKRMISDLLFGEVEWIGELEFLDIADEIDKYTWPYGDVICHECMTKRLHDMRTAHPDWKERPYEPRIGCLCWLCMQQREVNPPEAKLDPV